MRTDRGYNLQTTGFPIIGGSAFGRYAKQTTEATWNMMVGNNKGEPALVNYLGFELALQLRELGQPRDLFVSVGFNKIIAVFGKSVVTISPSLAYGVIGELVTEAGNVSITENLNNEIAIADSTENLYVFNFGTSTFTVIQPGFIATYLTTHDSYIWVAIQDSPTFRLSELNNALLYPVTLEANIQSKPDKIQAVINFENVVATIGTITTTFWHNQGLPVFPYVPDKNIVMSYGTVNANTVDVLTDQYKGVKLLVFLAKNDKSNPFIAYSTGGQIINVSAETQNDGLDFRLSQLKNPEDSFGFIFQEDGHVLYQLVFPSDDFSLVYDFTSKLFYNISDRKMQHHPAKRHVFFSGKDYFINFTDSRLFEMGTQFTTYDGEVIPRVRITPPIRVKDDQSFPIRNIKITMQHGVNPEGGIVDMAMSKDGGLSYGNFVAIDLNNIGNSQQMINWWNLGRSNDFRFQFRFQTRGSVVITGGSMKALQ